MPDNDSSLPSSLSSETKLEVLKVGSDPEALFTNDAGVLLDATRYVGRNRIMSAWIGTDGNTSTAELRPRPAKDVFLHVRDIAEAMSVIYETVCKEPNVHLIAQPFHESSALPCGGHVHFSFLLHDPIAVPMILRGHVVNVTGSGLREAPVSRRAVIGATPASRLHYTKAASDGTAFSLYALARKLHYVVDPLENLYPTAQRLRRTYGGGEDALRAEFSPTPVKPDVLRWRLEYRYPSTWLAHPALAVAYLGLTKLTVNNYHTGLMLMQGSAGPLPPTLLPGYIDEVLRRHVAVVTPDVQHLPRVLRFVLTEIAPRLSAPSIRVDFEAWAKFLNEGRWK